MLRSNAEDTKELTSIYISFSLFFRFMEFFNKNRVNYKQKRTNPIKLLVNFIKFNVFKEPLVFLGLINRETDIENVFKLWTKQALTLFAEIFITTLYLFITVICLLNSNIFLKVIGLALAYRFIVNHLWSDFVKGMQKIMRAAKWLN